MQLELWQTAHRCVEVTSAAFTFQPLRYPSKSHGTATAGHLQTSPSPSHAARVNATSSTPTWCFAWHGGKQKKVLIQETLFQSQFTLYLEKKQTNKQKNKPFKISASKGDIEKQSLLECSHLTIEIARLKLSCGVVLLDLRRERSCISRLLSISKIYGMLHQ